MFRSRSLFIVSITALLFLGCSDDTGSPADGSTGKSDAASDGKMVTGDAGGVTVKDYAGNWTGTWKNTTFGSTGAVKMTVTVDEAKKSVDLTLDLDGNVFGGTNPPAETFTGSYDTNGFTVTTKSTLFGDLSLTFKADGSISGKGKPAGFDDVTFTGTGTAKKISMTYIINQGGKKFAEGTFELNKQ